MCVWWKHLRFIVLDLCLCSWDLCLTFLPCESLQLPFTKIPLAMLNFTQVLCSWKTKLEEPIHPFVSWKMAVLWPTLSQSQNTAPPSDSSVASTDLREKLTLINCPISLLPRVHPTFLCVVLSGLILFSLLKKSFSFWPLRPLQISWWGFLPIEIAASLLLP